MDFLDPKKERRNRTMLLLGYGLIAIAIAIATLVLLYQSYGYSVNRQGKVTQNGLVFVSSQPSGAAIYLNGKLYKSNTNARVVVPANNYQLQIVADGYRTWQRPIVVNGGDVQHFDYPFLIPNSLQTTTLADLEADPLAATQSPDKRWLLMAQPGSAGSFTEYDLKSPDKPVATTVTLPDGSFTAGNGTQAWSLVEWASDNTHVLLLHTYTVNGTASQEYVLLDRGTPVDSVNLTNSLNLTQGETLNLFNNRVDAFYMYNPADTTLSRINASDDTVLSKIGHVLAFKTYADDKLLYITDQSPTGKTTPGQVSAVLQDGQKTITLRTLPAGASSYVLNLAQYSGDWYIAVAAANDSAVYIYKNPQDQSTTSTDSYPSSWRRLSVKNPTFLSFSSNTQFLLAESGQQFVVYDLENVAQYRYTATKPIDTPQGHATWMDGDRLTYVSGGKLEMFDYDYRNQQTLVAANPNFLPFFASNYSYLYTLRPASGDNSKPALTTTPLVIKK